MYIIHVKSCYPFGAHWQLFEAPATTIRKPAFCAQHERFSYRLILPIFIRHLPEHRKQPGPLICTGYTYLV